MARSDPRSAANERRTGVIPRPASTRHKPSNARLDWLAFIAVAVLAVFVLLFLLGMIGGAPTAVLPSPSSVSTLAAAVDPTGMARTSLLPTYSAEPASTPSASPTAAPTPTPTQSPTPSPTPTPNPTPTPTPSPSPSPTPPPPTQAPIISPAPTIPAVGLVIVDPMNGRATAESSVVVRGLAQPGSTITRDIPFWFDEHTIADSAGRWSFALGLNVGENVFTFRIGDDSSTAQTLTIYRFDT